MNIKITLSMLMCGIGAVGAAGAAGAATPDSDAPSIALKYDPVALNTDGGARKLYARIETAAAKVCPSYGDPIIVSQAAWECRQHAIESAVEKTHNPRLAAIYLSNSKRG
jgi:UrcA family protein